MTTNYEIGRTDTAPMEGYNNRLCFHKRRPESYLLRSAIGPEINCLPMGLNTIDQIDINASCVGFQILNDNMDFGEGWNRPNLVMAYGSNALTNAEPREK